MPGSETAAVVPRLPRVRLGLPRRDKGLKRSSRGAAGPVAVVARRRAKPGDVAISPHGSIHSSAHKESKATMMGPHAVRRMLPTA